MMGSPDFRCGDCRHYSRTKPDGEYKNGMQYYGFCGELSILCHANETACRLIGKKTIDGRIVDMLDAILEGKGPRNG